MWVSFCRLYFCIFFLSLSLFPFLSHGFCLFLFCFCLVSASLSFGVCLGSFLYLFWFVSVFPFLSLSVLGNGDFLWVSVFLGLWILDPPSLQLSFKSLWTLLKGRRTPRRLTLSPPPPPRHPDARVSVMGWNKPQALKEDLILWEPAWGSWGS